MVAVARIIPRTLLAGAMTVALGAAASGHAQTLTASPGQTAASGAQTPATGPQPRYRSAGVKRLPRSRQALGWVDDHTCTLERRYREEDYLAALPDKEVARYIQLAQGGDADAMYLLAQIPRPLAGAGRAYPYREPWLDRAGQAGHPIAKYQLGGAQHEAGQLDDAQYLNLIEAAALAQGSGDIAWRLAFSYKNPDIEKGDIRFKVARNFLFIRGDKAKALHWARIAAGKGNIMAAEDLCTTMVMDTQTLTYGLPQRDPAEALQWCTLAAQAMCSRSAPLDLAQMFEKGIGVPKSSVDALYWRRIHLERFDRNFKAIGQWEYLGGMDHE